MAERTNPLAPWYGICPFMLLARSKPLHSISSITKFEQVIVALVFLIHLDAIDRAHQTATNTRIKTTAYQTHVIEEARSFVKQPAKILEIRRKIHDPFIYNIKRLMRT